MPKAQVGLKYDWANSCKKDQFGVIRCKERTSDLGSPGDAD